MPAYHSNALPNINKLCLSIYLPDLIKKFNKMKNSNVKLAAIYYYRIANLSIYCYYYKFSAKLDFKKRTTTTIIIARSAERITNQSDGERKRAE